MSTGAYNNAPSASDGGRAFGPGPRWAYGAALIAALLVAGLLVMVLKPSSPSGTVAGGLATSSVYGHPPAWLKHRIPEPIPVRVVSATPAHPDYQAVEGYTVLGAIASGSVKVMAEGPSTPAWVSSEAQGGHWKTGELAPSTFDVRFTDTRGTIPLRAGAFTIINNQGVIFHPRVSVVGGGSLPSQLTNGQSLQLKLQTALPEGDGSLRWAPVGERILVGWTWTLELD